MLRGIHTARESHKPQTKIKGGDKKTDRKREREQGDVKRHLLFFKIRKFS
jgi:hypothetical protein